MKWFIIVLLFLVATVVILQSFVFDHLETNIEDRNFQYSEELGWVNWNHAYPKGTIESYSALQQLNKSATDSFSFTYSQKMKFKFGNSAVVAEYKECRLIKPHLTLKEGQEVFMEMFKSVSNSFEKMQGEFPFNVISDSYNSSFREGDLMGNIISCYCAISNTQVNEIKNNLTLYDAEKSLEIYERNNLKKIQWEGVMIKSKKYNKLLCDLQNIIDMSNQKHSSLSRVMSREDGLYME
ncbi:MAG: hypothetical protein ACKOXB_07890 [Flavobacteriales bacterium]